MAVSEGTAAIGFERAEVDRHRVDKLCCSLRQGATAAASSVEPMFLPFPHFTVHFAKDLVETNILVGLICPG